MTIDKAAVDFARAQARSKAFHYRPNLGQVKNDLISIEHFGCSDMQEHELEIINKSVGLETLSSRCSEGSQSRLHWLRPVKNPAAVSLGSLGGKASALSLSKEERVARATKAVQAREAKRALKKRTA